ncbi:MAG: hypothetical protein ACKOOL_06295 [Novosphingobium sp.]
MSDSPKSTDEFGEGNYKAAREYDESAKRFARTHKDQIEGMAEDAAAALDGPEGDKLEQAEAEARSRAKA